MQWILIVEYLVYMDLLCSSAFEQHSESVVAQMELLSMTNLQQLRCVCVYIYIQYILPHQMLHI